ncbi:MAG: NAD-dependent epimerase/dehydratase [Betaproteobacteria bacterium]|nr:NAD-dependent epimerase/dehydratase [Betaproteobacteria bacterium]
MREKLFLAGAAGAIGRVLGPLLVRAGYEVHGSTRQEAQALRAQGVTPVVVDVFDAPALNAALLRVAPAIVVHQLTDLPQKLEPSAMAAALARNARVREVGTRNLVAAAIAAGTKRMVAQSIAWAYAAKPLPYVEEDALDLQASGDRLVSVRGVATLEDAVLHSAPLVGTVLRYGHLYGPGTGFDARRGASPLHVEAAALAALLAVQRGVGGVFNIAEENAEVDSAKARRELGFDASARVKGAS